MCSSKKNLCIGVHRQCKPRRTSGQAFHISEDAKKFLRQHSGGVLAAGPGLLPNGKTVVSGAADSVVLVWDVAAGQLLRALLGHTQSIAAVATTEDPQGPAAGSVGVYRVTPPVSAPLLSHTPPILIQFKKVVFWGEGFLVYF